MTPKMYVGGPWCVWPLPKIGPCSWHITYVKPKLWAVFMPPPNVVWPEAYCFGPIRLCVHPETLLAQYLAEYLTHFHQTYISDALWDTDERVKIWGQRSRSCWNKVCWKQHFLGLLTRCLEKYSRIFTKLTPVMYCRTEMNALNFGIKRSKFKVAVE